MSLMTNWIPRFKQKGLCKRSFETDLHSLKTLDEASHDGFNTHG